MPPPLVSIGLPTYNRAASLERAARSALAQDWSELELVISDNGSDDDTQAICEALRDADPRVRYVRQAVNLGPLRNFEEVFEHSRGELFMWLGDDDTLDPSYVSECAQRAARERGPHARVRPGAVLPGRDVRVCRAGREPARRLAHAPPRRLLPAGHTQRRVLRRHAAKPRRAGAARGRRRRGLAVRGAPRIRREGATLRSTDHRSLGAPRRGPSPSARRAEDAETATAVRP